MSETKTDFVVSAKTKGFQELQQQAQKVIDSAKKATQDQTKGFSQLEKNTKTYKTLVKELETNLKGLTKSQLALNLALNKTKDGTKEYKELEGQLKKVTAEYGKLAKVTNLTKQAFGKGATGAGGLQASDLARHGFTQGLLQGTSPDMFGGLGRGPGMWRQAAGLSVGRGLHGVPGAMFGGVSGFQQGLAGIPVGGGIVAGQLGTAMGFGEGALNLQRTRLAALPYFGGGGMGGIKSAGTAAEKEVPFLSEEDFYKQAKGKLLSYRSKPGTGAAVPQGRRPIEAMADALSGKEIRGKLSPADEERIKNARSAYVTDYEKRKDAARTTAEISAQAEAFADVKAQGYRLSGMSEQEAIQAALPILQRGGGTAAQMRAQGMTQMGFAAQTAYGVGADISGAFLGAGRRGGIVGAQGQAGEAMANALTDAIKLGMEGTEIPDYLQAIAEGQERWKTTGIEIDPKSLKNMATTFSATGLGAVRGTVMAQGMQEAGRRLSMGGPQDTLDLMMMQAAGFKGGGLKDVTSTLERLESGGLQGEELRGFIGRLSEMGGGGESGQWVMKQALGKKGMQMSWGNARLLQKWASGESLNPDEMKAVNKAQTEMTTGAEKAPRGIEGFTAKAETIMASYGKNIQRSADLQNQQNDIGNKFLKSLLDLQKAGLNINGAFETLASGGIKAMTGGILDFTNIVKAVVGEIMGTMANPPAKAVPN